MSRTVRVLTAGLIAATAVIVSVGTAHPTTSTSGLLADRDRDRFRECIEHNGELYCRDHDDDDDDDDDDENTGLIVLDLL